MAFFTSTNLTFHSGIESTFLINMKFFIDLFDFDYIHFKFKSFLWIVVKLSVCSMFEIF